MIVLNDPISLETIMFCRIRKKKKKKIIYPMRKDYNIIYNSATHCIIVRTIFIKQ